MLPFLKRKSLISSRCVLGFFAAASLFFAGSKWLLQRAVPQGWSFFFNSGPSFRSLSSPVPQERRFGPPFPSYDLGLHLAIDDVDDFFPSSPRPQTPLLGLEQWRGSPGPFPRGSFLSTILDVSSYGPPLSQSAGPKKPLTRFVPVWKAMAKYGTPCYPLFFDKWTFPP